MHSEMWWPRLFVGGPAIEWDDYEKDYSDLPPPVLAAHQVSAVTHQQLTMQCTALLAVC